MCESGCPISERAVIEALAKAPDRRSYTDFVGSRDVLVAMCGAADRVFVFRQPPVVDRRTLRRNAPAVSALWNVGDQVRHRLTSPPSDDPFETGTAEDQRARETLGTSLVRELVSGRFTNALGPDLVSRLTRYTGPPTQRGPLPIELLDRDALGLVTYVAPEMPPIALAARAFGDVTMRLTVTPDSGEVTDAVSLDGNPLLLRAALTAARRWRFAPRPPLSTTVEATVRFAIRCPER